MEVDLDDEEMGGYNYSPPVYNSDECSNYPDECSTENHNNKNHNITRRSSRSSRSRSRRSSSLSNLTAKGSTTTNDWDSMQGSATTRKGRSPSPVTFKARKRKRSYSPAEGFLRMPPSKILKLDAQSRTTVDVPIGLNGAPLTLKVLSTKKIKSENRIIITLEYDIFAQFQSFEDDESRMIFRIDSRVCLSVIV